MYLMPAAYFNNTNTNCYIIAQKHMSFSRWSTPKSLGIGQTCILLQSWQSTTRVRNITPSLRSCKCRRHQFQTSYVDSALKEVSRSDLGISEQLSASRNFTKILNVEKWKKPKRLLLLLTSHLEMNMKYMWRIITNNFQMTLKNWNKSTSDPTRKAKKDFQDCETWHAGWRDSVSWTRSCS